jgi:hypothetical protein
MKKLAKVFTVLCCLILLAAAALYVYTHPGREPGYPVDVPGPAYMDEVDGTRVLHLKGSPYEMGYQHGYLARDTVRQSLAQFDQLLDRAKDEVGLPRFAAELILDCVYRRCSKDIPERFKRETEGLADGAGVDLQLLRRSQVVSVVTERACSVFAVFGNATKDGKVYHGRNFDWIMDAGLQDTAVLILYEPRGHIPFASAGYIGQVGVISGMNMEGIAIGMIGAITDDSDLSGIPMMLLHRRVLEEAGNLDEATRIIRDANRTVGYNYIVADGDAGAARAYETSANQFAMFTDNDPKETVEYAIPIDDAVFRADEAMDQGVRRFQRCAKGYPNMPYGSNSYDHRYKGMATRIREHYGVIDDTIALDIVKAVAMRNANLHSVLCDATDRVMWVAHAKGTEDAWKQPYVRYDLKQLFVRPEDRTGM